MAVAEEGLCQIRASSPYARVDVRTTRTANLESLKQSKNSFLLMESFLPEEHHCFQTQVPQPVHHDSAIFPIYFIFPDSYIEFYTNAGSNGSSEEAENNKV